MNVIQTGETPTSIHAEITRVYDGAVHFFHFLMIFLGRSAKLLHRFDQVTCSVDAP